MKKLMTEAEINEEAENLDKLTEAYSKKVRDEMIAYAEANVDKEIQIAFLTAVSLAVAGAALEATANGLDKFGPKILGAEGGFALDAFGDEIVPQIVRLAKHLGRGAFVVVGKETIQ